MVVAAVPVVVIVLYLVQSTLLYQGDMGYSGRMAVRITCLLVTLAAMALVDVIPDADTPCELGAPDVDCADGFAPSYFHARQAFRAAAAEAGADATVLPVHTDPATGLEYTIDVAVFPADAAAAGGDAAGAPLLVHMSGVHGVEGFAGSAVQVAALRERARARADAARTGRSLPPAAFTTCFVASSACPLRPRCGPAPTT